MADIFALMSRVVITKLTFRQQRSIKRNSSKSHKLSKREFYLVFFFQQIINSIKNVCNIQLFTQTVY